MSNELKNAFAEAGATMYQLMQDKNFREQLEAREKQLNEEREMSRLMERLEKERYTATAERNVVMTKIASASAELRAAKKHLQKCINSDELH